MSASARETVLAALHTMLVVHMPAGSVGERNATLPARLPAGGLAILRDGDPGEPEFTFSPATWHWQHRAEIDLLVEGLPAGRDATFDALTRAIGAAVAADRTLGGLCDWVQAEAPAPLQLVVDGAEGIKAATIAVVLHYATSDTL
jgi:hypothetical protein